MSASRPETGATAERLTVMTNLAINTYRESFTMSGDGSHVGAMRDAVAAVLIAVVPEGSVIALAEHVLSAADREAIGALLDWAIPTLKLKRGESGSLEEYIALSDRRSEGRKALKEEYLARLDRLRGSGGEAST